MFKKASACIFILLIGMLCSGQIDISVDEDLRQNVRIDVEIKKLGYRDRPLGITTVRQETRQTIVVLEGHEATLFIGKKIPYARKLIAYLVNGGYIEVIVDYRDVGSSLKVRPRIYGNMIVVTLTPEISYVSDKGRGIIAVDKLSTTVRVLNGQSIRIGGSFSRSETEKEFNELFYRDEQGEGVIITLTPRIMEM